MANLASLIRAAEKQRAARTDNSPKEETAPVGLGEESEDSSPFLSQRLPLLDLPPYMLQDRSGRDDRVPVRPFEAPLGLSEPEPEVSNPPIPAWRPVAPAAFADPVPALFDEPPAEFLSGTLNVEDRPVSGVAEAPAGPLYVDALSVSDEIESPVSSGAVVACLPDAPVAPVSAPRDPSGPLSLGQETPVAASGVTDEIVAAGAWDEPTAAQRQENDLSEGEVSAAAMSCEPAVTEYRRDAPLDTPVLAPPPPAALDPIAPPLAGLDPTAQASPAVPNPASAIPAPPSSVTSINELRPRPNGTGPESRESPKEITAHQLQNLSGEQMEVLKNILAQVDGKCADGSRSIWVGDMLFQLIQMWSEAPVEEPSAGSRAECAPASA